jgi:predicted heme/steroid binding protein
MRQLTVFLVALMVLVAWPAVATEDYAELSGEECAYCHLDQGGGGPLTLQGSAFAVGGYKWPIPAGTKAAHLSGGMKWLRFLLGFIHLLAAIAWFGTIFYVHLVLRPSYAKGGLPKTEVRIAWGAMVALLATGIPLTKLRFHNPEALFATHSGNLLLIKIGLFLFLVCSAAFITLILSPKLKKLRASWQQNDGLGGHPSWVKVDDLLYDVTDSKRWQGGNHFGRHQAGEDLTEALKGAPHGIEKLEEFRSFSLVGGGLHKESLEVRVLFIMAYVNLFVAFGVVVVLALWRWG